VLSVRSHRAATSGRKRWLAKVGITAAVALGATAATTAVAAGSASAATYAYETPAVAIWGSTQTVTAGSSIKIWASVTHPGTTSRINTLSTQLQEWTNSGWKTIYTQSLGPNGYNQFEFAPDMSRKYRVYFPGWMQNGRWVYGSAASGYYGVTMVSPPASQVAAAVVAEAKAQLGKWYVFGAAGPNTFDCSGLTQYVFRKYGVNLPHSAASQRYYGYGVSASQARAGDIVVFSEGGTWGHVGIYLGGGYMIDAPHSGAQVRIERVWSDTVMYRRLVG